MTSIKIEFFLEIDRFAKNNFFKLRYLNNEISTVVCLEKYRTRGHCGAKENVKKYNAWQSVNKLSSFFCKSGHVFFMDKSNKPFLAGYPKGQSHQLSINSFQYFSEKTHQQGQ